jgi:hypothetical protein
VKCNNVPYDFRPFNSKEKHNHDEIKRNNDSPKQMAQPSQFDGGGNRFASFDHGRSGAVTSNQ